MTETLLLIFCCFVIVFCVDITVSQPTKNGEQDLLTFLQEMGVNATSVEKLTKGELMYALGNAQAALKTSKRETRVLKRTIWKVAPREYLYDIQAEFKPRYDKFMSELVKNETAHKEADDEVQVPRGSLKPPYVILYPTPHENDPEAMRIRQTANFFDWLTKYQVDDMDVKIILQNMDEKYRSMHTPPIPKRNKSCRAAGIASESASLTIVGDMAQKLMRGELTEMNIYGPEVDPYLLPLLNALGPLVPRIKPSLNCTI